MKYPKDLKGIRFGKLIAIELTGRNKYNAPMWNCICDCGKDKVISRNKLVTNNTKSCGCYQREIQVVLKTTHGMNGTRFNGIYKGMKSRCEYEKGKAYPNYGGRGIHCLWKSFLEFKEDMYDSYNSHVEEFGTKNTTIDRIDNYKGYFKENCRWATLKEQANNKRKPAKKYLLYEYKGEVKTKGEWMESLKLVN